MPESSPGSIRSLASVATATTLWPRALSALVENAATTISGERYKAGKEKPRTGALFNYNPRHSLNFQILVLIRQAC